MNYSVLFPAFSKIFESSTEGLSALIWILLYLGFIFSIGMAISNYLGIKKNISYLIRFFKNLDSDLSNWKALYAKEINPLANFASRNQLREFRRALNSYDQVYYSPAPAKYFFGIDTIAANYFHNKIIEATPGLLVGFGLVGTFMGLQISLGSIKLSDSATIINQIGYLISGASLAFVTSVWGTLFSLLFNLIDKILSNKILKQVDLLSVHVEKKFTLSTPEQFLVKLLNATNSKQLDSDHIASAINHSQAKNIDLMEGMMNNFAKNMAQTLSSEMRNQKPKKSKLNDASESRLGGISDSQVADPATDNQAQEDTNNSQQKKEAI